MIRCLDVIIVTHPRRVEVTTVNLKSSEKKRGVGGQRTRSENDKKGVQPTLILPRVIKKVVWV